MKHKIEFIEVRPESIKQCAKYIPHEEIVDIVHAATCLQTSAILISNDKHFNKLNESEVIEVWTISKAVKRCDGTPNRSRAAGHDVPSLCSFVFI